MSTRKSFRGVVEGRITIVLLFFLLALAALVGRLFLLQVVQHHTYQELATRQHQSSRLLVPTRGSIFVLDKDSHPVPLALTRGYQTVAISPKLISKPDEVTAALGKELGIKPEDVLAKLSRKDDPYEIISRKVDPEKAEKISALRIPGIILSEEKRRLYPAGTLAAHILGFVSQEVDREEGRYGLERFYEGDLSGKNEAQNRNGSQSSFFGELGRKIFYPSAYSTDLFLTLDYRIQIKAEEVLAKLKEKWQATSAIVLVLEPATGRVLAGSALPTFDPNEFGKVRDFSTFLNPAVESTFELGSVLKPITVAGGLEEKLITPESTYEDKGEVRLGGYTIKNFDGKAYGVQTMMQVLEKSLNTGAVHTARLLGQEKQLQYLTQFGFGQKTGIDLPGEVAGNLSHLRERREIDFATASFGQGIAVTPLQLALAVGAIANGGDLMRPYVVDRLIDTSGSEVKSRPQVVRRVISREAAEALTKMLVSAVRNGFENRASVKGYFVAGKTGTAQIPKRDGRGYSDKVIHTFVGYAPAFNPRFLVLLQLNEPIGNRFAANTLTPAFHDLAEYILNYYEVPPDKK